MRQSLSDSMTTRDFETEPGTQAEAHVSTLYTKYFTPNFVCIQSEHALCEKKGRVS